ncbi:SLATT domain-containing protein [Nocardia sp. NPDC101769]|uniref:SLATT domain-containing protein n=1 Tax=Nocardia sp. NPDC101769 TaxID=3364333 RepID=UPI003824E9AF
MEAEVGNEEVGNEEVDGKEVDGKEVDDREFAESKIALNHRIRKNERDLALAKRRRSWSNYSIALGPILALILYALWWVPQVSPTLLKAIYYPAIPVSIAFCIASYYLKTHPGGPVERARPGEFGSEVNSGEGSGILDPDGLRVWQTSFLRRIFSNDKRRSIDQIELALDYAIDSRKSLYTLRSVPIDTRRSAYKEDARADVERFREEGSKYRRTNNNLQVVLIVGSLAATAASGVSGEFGFLRWAVLALTFTVGVASGLMAYFKFKERSFYLQQTADDVEYEIEALEIGVGRYKHIEDPHEALKEFASEVHRLKAEQRKREQNLEQPPDLNNPSD